MYRMPKAVALELRDQSAEIQGLCKSGVNALPLSAVGFMAESWSGVEGRAWASKITDRVLSLAESLLEENRVAEIVVDEVGPEQIPAEPVGFDVDAVAVSVMAADAAIDAAQALLEGYGEDDSTFSQAYHLMCAADAVLSKVVEALGLADADDEMGEVEPVDEPRSNDVELEERKSAIASAERLTFDAEVRAIATDDGSLRIGGYAAQFNQEATGLNFREMIAPGAFTRSLASDAPVFLLVNHDTDQLPLASTQGGTLVLSEDSVGLRMDAVLDPSNPRAAELASALTRGDVDKMSFAFTVAPDGESREAGLRTLTDLNLFEVSVVTWPAYDASSVGMRSADDSDGLELRKRLIELKLKFNSLKK